MWVRDANGRYYDSTSPLSKACASFAHVSFLGGEARIRREKAEERRARSWWRRRFTRPPVAEQAEIDGLSLLRDVLQGIVDGEDA